MSDKFWATNYPENTLELMVSKVFHLNVVKAKWLSEIKTLSFFQQSFHFVLIK